MMTADQLKARITELKSTADTLPEPEKFERLNEILELEQELEGKALDDIADKLKGQTLPDPAEIDTKIAEAKNAMLAQQQRVKAFDWVYGVLKKVVGLL